MPDEIIARVKKNVTLGITTFIVSFGRKSTERAVELFGREVIPAFR
jgi:hypothetical protein